ncbi:MAG: transposase [Elainellaceae cyanobacterium]
MPRRKTAFLPGYHYHLYNRGNNCQNIFFGRENYRFFLTLFRRYLVEPQSSACALPTLDVVAYCLMPNHYHFLVRLRESNLSEQMGFFSLAYTKAINRRFRRCGSLFQGRFQAIHVGKEAYLTNLTRYIHLNPVKAGLVERAEEWEFSSYRDYVELRRGTLPQFSEVRGGSAAGYRAFVEGDDYSQPALLRLMLDF